jgi:hypothetical protein
VNRPARVGEDLLRVAVLGAPRGGVRGGSEQRHVGDPRALGAAELRAVLVEELPDLVVGRELLLERLLERLLDLEPRELLRIAAEELGRAVQPRGLRVTREEADAHELLDRGAAVLRRVDAGERRSDFGRRQRASVELRDLLVRRDAVAEEAQGGREAAGQECDRERQSGRDFDGRRLHRFPVSRGSKALIGRRTDQR